MLKQTVLASLCALAFFVSCNKRDITEPGLLVPKTVDQDPGLPSVKIGGNLLHSEAFGHPDSTLVICIHGGPGSDYRYLLNCKDLAGYGYRVVFYDQIGSGLSQRVPKSFFENYSSDLLRYFYDELDAIIAHYRTKPNQKVFLLGHSWGGMLATGFAGRYPNKVQALVVGEPGGLNWDEIMEYGKNLTNWSLWGEFFNNATYLDQFITAKPGQHEILDYKAGILAGAKMPTSGDDGRAAESFWRIGSVINGAAFELGDKQKPNLKTGLENFNVPVLYLYGGGNTAHNDAWAQKISSAYNYVEVVKTGGTHSDMISDVSIWHNTTLPKILSYFRSR